MGIWDRSPVSLWSREVGVGNRVGASVSRDGRTAAPALADWFDPYGVEVGVGNMAATWSESSFERWGSDHLVGSPTECAGRRPSHAVGVAKSGEDENPAPAVRCPDIGCANTAPFRIEPEVGQVSKNGSECPQMRFSCSVSQTPRAWFHVAVGSGTS